MWVLVSRFGLDRFRDRPPPGALPGTALLLDLKFRSFFQPLSQQNAFSSLSGCLLEFWWCMKRRGAQMCAFGVLGFGATGASHGQNALSSKIDFIQ